MTDSQPRTNASFDLRVGAVGATLALVLSLLIWAAPTTSASSAAQRGDIAAGESVDRDGISARRTKQPIGKYKCGAWSRTVNAPFYGQLQARSCTRFSSHKKKFNRDYATDGFNSSYKHRVEFKCTSVRTTRWEFSMSASVEAQAGLIFAKATASLTGTVLYAVETADSATGRWFMQPRTGAHCIRGVRTHEVKGVMRNQFRNRTDRKDSWSKPQWSSSAPKRYVASIPANTSFIYGDGRL